MSKLYYKALIEDCVNDKCSTAEQEYLMEVYTYAVKRMATTLARKAWFELEDFAGTKKQGIAGFSLIIERAICKGVEQWVGTFRSGDKNLKIIAILER